MPILSRFLHPHLGVVVPGKRGYFSSHAPSVTVLLPPQEDTHSAEDEMKMASVESEWERPSVAHISRRLAHVHSRRRLSYLLLRNPNHNTHPLLLFYPVGCGVSRARRGGDHFHRCLDRRRERCEFLRQFASPLRQSPSRRSWRCGVVHDLHRRVHVRLDVAHGQQRLRRAQGGAQDDRRAPPSRRDGMHGMGETNDE